MGFYAPWLLLGGLAVSIPLILHFFYRARYRKVPWGAMSFLKAAIEQTSRRLRFQEWVLLALRCLVLLLLAFALARPTLTQTVGGGRGDAVDAIFVFDTSYSMGTRAGDKSRLDHAKVAALAVIDNLPPNSTVQVISCSDRAVPHGPQSPGNLDQARQAVNDIELTSLATDLLPGFSEAFTALDRGAGMNKEVYVFSDLAKSGFERQSAALRGKADEIKGRATLLLVRCGQDLPANAAITDITFPGGIPHKGARIPFTVLLRNTGTKPVTNANVTLEVDGRSTEKETASVAVIAPGQTTPVTLTALLEDPGIRVVTARLTSDDLSGDNRLDKVISVRDRVNVVIVDGAPDPGDAKDSASHFIRNAILPVSAMIVDDYFVRVNVVPADEAGPGLLAGCDLVVLANVPSSHADRPGVPGLHEDFVLRLAEFVKAGGGLVIGSGDNVLPARYNQVFGIAGVNLLPCELDAVTSTTIEKPFRIAPDTIEPGSYLSRFRDEPYKTVTGDVELTKLISLYAGDETSRTLLKTTDARPLLVSKTLGEGEVLFLATTLDMKWNNWPAKAGSFLPFAQLTLAQLTNKGVKGANRIAGESIAWNPPEYAKGFDLVRPDGMKVSLGKATGGSGERFTVVAKDVPASGVYRIVSETDEVLKSPPFAVSPDLRESVDLNVMSDRDIETALGFSPVFLQAGTGAETAIASERSRREWTVWVLALLFIVASGEAVWAWLCGRDW